MARESDVTIRNAARDGLLRLQQEDGRFEGRLSSNTYPTLAVALVDWLLDRPVDPAHIGWLERRQLEDGRFPLDPEDRPDDEVTRFARVVLRAYHSREPDPRIAAMLERIPLHDWNLWLTKVFGALAGQYPWEKIPPPKAAEWAGKIVGRLLPVLPRALFAKVKPPPDLAPPVSLFFQPAFERLFIAEQYTMAPMLFLIEAHTRRREEVLRDLLTWILARQGPDGSWFDVGFITAIATMALIVAEPLVPELSVRRPLQTALAWLDGTRNPDGGHREAISLNVWDTSLACLALMRLGIDPKAKPIDAAARWLAAAQNHDGGWAFHALRGPSLPSDADDTALATRVLARNGRHSVAVERGVRWLLDRQAKEGSWPTYVPELGDVGCVSVTTHAIETLLELGEEGPVERALRWLERAQHRDGYWEDLWIAKRTYGTAKALLAFARAGAPDRPAVRRGVDWLRGAENEDGGWGERQNGDPAPSTAEQTGVVVQALRALGEDAESGLAWLRDHQRDDGGWDPSPVGIYWEVIGGYANPMNAWVFPIFGLTEGDPE